MDIATPFASPIPSPAATPVATPVVLEIATPIASPAPATSAAATSTPIPTGRDSTDSTGQNWNVILAMLGVVLSLVLLWTGIKKLELASPIKAVLSFLDLALLIVGVVSLGWAGAFLAAVVNVLALVAHSIYLAIQYDDILTDAAVQNDSDRNEIKALAKRLQSSGGAFKVFGPIKTANFIKCLSQRARTVSEIEQMAPQIAALWVVFRPDLESLIEKFDRLLRLSGEPAGEAQQVADVLTTGTQRAAATFDEVLDGMLALYDPSITGS